MSRHNETHLGEPFMFRALIAIIFLSLPSVTLALTPVEIQNKWASQGTLSGSFVTKDDSTQEKGRFTFVGPSKLIMVYTRTKARMTFTGEGVTIEDTKYPQNNTNKADSRLKKVFSATPAFAGLINIQGSNEKHTMIGFRDSDGAIKVYFSNMSGRMTHLEVTSPSGTTITHFKY